MSNVNLKITMYILGEKFIWYLKVCPQNAEKIDPNVYLIFLIPNKYSNFFCQN